MHSKNLRAYLDSAAGIAALLPQAERLIGLRRIYNELLPQQLLRSSSIVNYKQQKVVIFAENNAIAAKLRLLSPRIVNGFSKSGVEVTGIRIEVQPLEQAPQSAKPKQAILSQAGLERLEALAAGLKDSTLKQSLESIAAHGRSAQDTHAPVPVERVAAPSRKSK